MKGRCQTCGATAPLDWFLTEPIARQVLAVALKLPQSVQKQLLSYLGLFNPAGGTMQSKKALRLTTEISSQVAVGHIHIQGKVARPCSPATWAQAMEQMNERRDTLRLPLKNHNYLRQIAWAIADQEDAKKETVRNHAEQSGGIRRPGLAQIDDGLLPMERALKERAERLAKQQEDQ